MSIGTIILIILVIALLGGFSGIGGGPFYGTGYYGGGGLGLIIVILLILLLLGSYRPYEHDSRRRELSSPAQARDSYSRPRGSSDSTRTGCPLAGMAHAVCAIATFQPASSSPP